MTCELCGATPGWVHGYHLVRANESKRDAMRKCRELRAELAEYKQQLEAAEAKLRELEMQEPVQLEVSIAGIKWHFKCPQPLYAKPFPSKQEEK